MGYNNPTVRLKVVQINIFMGRYLPVLTSFLQKEDPDIIIMQEVSGFRRNNYYDKNIDLFKHLKKKLNLNGELAMSWRHKGDKQSYLGNAILTKGKILSSETVWLKEFREIDPSSRKPTTEPRNVLDVEIQFGSQTMNLLSTHGAWSKSPADTPEKLRQVKLLANHLKTLQNKPFILGGDFNVAPDTKVIKTIEKFAQNSANFLKVQNSLHPKLHYVAKTRSEGLLVDYIFASPDFKFEKAEAPIVDISDHLPIVATIELQKSLT